MRRFTAKNRLVMGLTAASFAAALTLGGGVPAQAAGGEVVVFQVDALPLKHYPNPQGCTNLSTALHHVLINQTDRPVKVYNLPNCIGVPLATVQPDTGAHADTFLSFSA
ncbi:hypothetical protein [Streptomyces luteireticuli]|uniref:hypothetical protein n=1 Tax=Streptomyces luteireticuli TaxID=173858 RepID=UPI003558145D